MTHIAHNWVPAPPDELVTDRIGPPPSGKAATTSKPNSPQGFSSGLSRAIELAIALRHLGATKDLSSPGAHTLRDTLEPHSAERHLSLVDKVNGLAE